jgi:transposase
MTRFVAGDDRSQSTLFPERLEDYLSEDSPVRAIDVFVDELDLAGLGFGGIEPEATGRPAYHPATLLKIYVYGYLNRVQSSRRLERECQRNIDLVWLTGRLMQDFKTVADFRKDKGEAVRGFAHIAADQARTGHQPEDREGARPCDPAGVTCAC